MRYVSTRGGMAPATFRDILLEGLAPDGGLAVPASYPRLDRHDLDSLRGRPYADVAFAVVSRFADDLPSAVLRDIVDRTYSAAVFGTDAVAPVEPLDGELRLLCLSNGPTLAFKDMAMQLLGNLFEHVLAEAGERLNILGATSGDTGSAAEHAMKGKRGVNVFMLSPYGKMSPFQAAQMYSLLDPNIFNLAVRGVFDDCQDLVKEINADAAFKREHRLGAVNSINWARITAQVVYYVSAYLAVTRSSDEPVAFAVPSGNFGNILSGHVARMMGVPIERLILATNENDVLDEFFRTGAYRVRPAERVHRTSSPSMDISKASNFERFVFDLTGRDADATRALFAAVETDGGFDLTGSAYHDKLGDFGFVSGSSTHADRIRTIRDLYERTGRIIDTHTADGVKVAREQGPLGMPVVCLETAQPAKFAEAIEEAIGVVAPRPAAFVGIEDLPQRVEVVDRDAAVVRSFIERHAR